ncbi:MAG: MFS transporter [Chitinophagales bacterium]|nr:MFS transporter [Chitinophagales bacterium]MDW8417874.1 hypothetical protein [Chitinophagales bacterium]
MKSLLYRYASVPRHIHHLMLADVCIQIINSAFTLLINYLMLEHGFKDYEIASMVGNRYLTVLLCAVPLAIIARGRRLKPFLMAGAVTSPLVALLLIASIHLHYTEMIRLLMAAWGVSFSLVQILVMPYVLSNGDKAYLTESITLFFSAANFTTIFTGLLAYSLPLLHPSFNTTALLVIFSTLGFGAVWFVHMLPDAEHHSLPARRRVSVSLSEYDWPLILQAVIPTFLIALGAGFTIPVINLFFHDVHGMPANEFSIINSVAFTLVAFSSLIIPSVKRRYGYQVAITGVQSVAIILLFMMATTEWYRHTPYGYWVAVITFVLRQPFMNMAGPMTSELTMQFVGERNRQLLSALNASIWSGCWFVSAKAFSVLREAGVAYCNIIFITVALYIAGVAWYYLLIRRHERVAIR